MALNNTWTNYAEPNITGYNEALTYINDVTSGYFGIGIIISLWVIIFLIFRKEGDVQAFAVANFLSLIVTGILRAMGQISDIWLVALIILTGLSVLLIWKKG